jgi:hypothetical protein
MRNDSEPTSVWVFNGPRSTFPSAIFSRKELADEWIKKNRLTGTLTAYPIDVAVYDWAISKGYFEPKKDEERSPAFIEKFSSGSQEHYHYEDGALA